jgi:NAD(P)-dependent dehydrogenase (short-subunit alcohol dehydrogenase family)
LTEDEFFSGLDVSARGAFLFSRAVLPLLLGSTAEGQKPAFPPTLIFTGATASVKANAHVAAFNTGKYALRALSSSLAKEFGPKGVHVGHAIIDGVIDIPRTKEWLKDAGPDSKISAEAIADAYWHLHTQPKSAFTWEIDIRPFVEKW